MRTTHPIFVIRPAQRAFAIALIILVAGCASDDTRTRGLGIDDDQLETVANAEARWSPGEEWYVDQAPALAIGGDETPAHQFHGIRGAVRLSDGRVGVGDAGSGQVRLYSPSGEFIGSAGRLGAGPEEFRRMTKLVRARADSLAVYDAGNRRISLLDSEGSFARSVSLTRFGVGADLVGVLGTGWFVLSTPVPRPPADGLSRDTVVYLLVPPEGGDRVDSLAVAPGGQRFQQMRGASVTRMSVPFGVNPVADARGDQVIIGATDTYEIHQHRIRAGQARIIQREVTPQPFTETHREAFIEDFPQFESALREIPLPRHRPVIGSVIIDAEGNLWIQDHPEQGSARTNWSIFSAEGVLRGSVALPTRFKPTEVGDDHVIGVARDELDVEKVYVFRLKKP